MAQNSLAHAMVDIMGAVLSNGTCISTVYRTPDGTEFSVWTLNGEGFLIAECMNGRTLCFPAYGETDEQYISDAESIMPEGAVKKSFADLLVENFNSSRTPRFRKADWND